MQCAVFCSSTNPTTANEAGLQGRDWNHRRREFWRMHFRPSWSVKTRDLLHDCSEGHAIGWLGMTSVFAFFVRCFTGNFTVHKTPLPTTRPGLQSRDCSHSRREFWRTHFRPSCSVNHVINFVTGRWEHVTSFVKARDWLTGYDVRGRVLLCWPAGWCFKSREAWASALCRWSPGRSEVDSSFQPAVHSNQFPGHPPPLLPT